MSVSTANSSHVRRSWNSLLQRAAELYIWHISEELIRAGNVSLLGGKRTPFVAKADEESKRYERDSADECPPIPGSLALIMECYQR